MVAIPPHLFGREAELDALLPVLDGAGPRVAYVWGVGGIGKSTLVRAFLAAHPTLATDEVDSTALPSDLSELVARVRAAELTVIDGLEQRPGLSELIRRQVLPRLPSGARLIVASREPPDPRWAAELGPGGFLALGLDRLSPEAAAALLSHWGVPEVAHDVVSELCHGHPLALVLASRVTDLDAFVNDGLDASPELVVALVTSAGLARDAALTRDVNTVCSIARRTTDALLWELFPKVPPERLSAALSAMVEQGWAHRDRDGVYPHDLIRDALRADAKWRDRARYERLFAAVAERVVARLREHGAPALPDAGHLLIDHPVYCRIAAHRGAIVPGPQRVLEDVAAFRGLLSEVVSRENLEHAAAWIERGRATVHVLEGEDGEPSEVACVLDTALLFEDTPVDDPVVAAARALVARLGYRPEASLMFSRLAVSAREGFASAAGNMRIMMMALAMGLGRGGLAGICSTVGPVELWRPMIEHTQGLGLFEVVRVGDMDFYVVLQDLRVRDIAGWFHAQLFPVAMALPPAIEALDRDEFTLAVRDALRVMSDPQRLAGTRLARTPVAVRAVTLRELVATPSEAIGAALRALLEDTIAEVTAADERVRGVMHRTYVTPAPKQLAAAAELGLSFATYRRALAAGVAAVTEALWLAELACSLATGP
ncbi:MAG: ATP-binding protein [Myxococcales bacterium]|nr:ATP-binding protein [Myxococcales bacterium]MCB9735898.1 ATP-binding protein [Deltaproteobacteria bacterium]